MVWSWLQQTDTANSRGCTPKDNSKVSPNVSPLYICPLGTLSSLSTQPLSLTPFNPLSCLSSFPFSLVFLLFPSLSCLPKEDQSPIFKNLRSVNLYWLFSSSNIPNKWILHYILWREKLGFKQKVDWDLWKKIMDNLQKGNKDKKRKKKWHEKQEKKKLIN